MSTPNQLSHHVSRPPLTRSAVHAGLLQRKCACGGAKSPSGECSDCRHKKKLGLQTKLRVNRPGDRYEREADRVAERVMRSTPLRGSQPILTSPMIQREAGGEAGTAPAVVHEALGEPGQALDEGARTFLEPRFGHDFSRVRVHTDARAAASARAVQARAYTVGADVVFDTGQYAPSTPDGRRLLAHELTHVVQQGQAQTLLQRDEDPAASHCGPDVTDWLIDQMNTNQNHPVIRTGREHRWPRWVPGFNLGWTAAAFYDFAELVGPGKPWDFKRTQTWWRAAEGRLCPSDDCDRTVTLCGHCFFYDVPGNLHYGWVGRRMEIAPWALHAGAGSVQEGDRSGDDPPDTVAINIGIAMADEGKSLCPEVRANLSSLNRDGTEGCPACMA